MVRTTRFRLFLESYDATLDEASANPRHVLRRDSDALSDLASRHTVRAEQDDARSANVSRVCRALCQQLLEGLPLCSFQLNVSHAQTDEACLRKIHLRSHAVH